MNADQNSILREVEMGHEVNAFYEELMMPSRQAEGVSIFMGYAELGVQAAVATLGIRGQTPSAMAMAKHWYADWSIHQVTGLLAEVFGQYPQLVVALQQWNALTQTPEEQAIDKEAARKLGLTLLTLAQRSLSEQRKEQAKAEGEPKKGI